MGFSQVIDGVKTFISTAKPILESVAPKMHESMKVFAERMIVMEEKYPSIGDMIKVIDKVAEIVDDVLAALGVDADSAAVLAMKAAQAEKGVSDFDSVQEYITYLKEKIKLDEEKFKGLSQEEKMVYTIAGIAIKAGAVGEKAGLNIPPEIVEMGAKVALAGKVVLSTKELLTLLSELKNKEIDDLSDICDVITGEGNSDRWRTSRVLEQILDEMRPGEGGKIVREIIDEIRE